MHHADHGPLDDERQSGRIVDAAVSEYGTVPESITVDNGTEFTGRAFEVWAVERGVRVNFIKPGNAGENGKG